MGTVVVVDDDRLVLYAVVAYLKSAGSRHSVQGSFGDPEKAIDFIAQHTCDLLVTDIKMPKMSGFELIERVKVLQPRIKVIILSGYADFALARNALNLRVDAYLLKHEIDERSLLASVDELLPAQITDASPGLRNNPRTVNQLFAAPRVGRGGWENDEAEDGAKRYLLAVYGYKRRYDEQARERPAAPNLTMLYQMIEDKLSRYGGSSCYLGNYQDIVIVVGSSEVDLSEKSDPIVHLKEVLRATARYLNFQVHIATEGKTVLSPDLERAYEEARELGEGSFFLRENAFILPQGPHKDGRTIPDLLLQDHILSGGWEQQLDQFFDLPFREFKDGAKRLKLHITAALEGLNSWLQRAYSTSFEEVLSETAGALYEHIYRIDDETVLRRRVSSICEAVAQAIAGHRHSNSVVISVRNYVDRHYGNPLSLNEMADIFNINMSYLSTLFKQELGIGFVEYVHQVRLKEACRLLADRNLSMKEIAFAVGYQDANHFSKIFSRTMGETATAYRERLFRERGAEDHP